MSAPATREQVMAALEALLTACYDFGAVTRRNTSPETIASPGSPALVLTKHHEKYERKPGGPPRRTMVVSAFIYIAAGADDNLIPDAILNPILDAFDAAFVADKPIEGRCTLGGLVYSAMINGELIAAPGDQTGQGVVIIPIEIVLLPISPT